MTQDTDGNDSNSYSISRRRALAGLGTIGAAAGIGGLGTYAQFTDTEGQDITFTSGGIDGRLSVSGSYNGNSISDDLTHVEAAEGGVGAGLELTDVKPGDFGCFVFELEVLNNPAWVGSCVGFDNNYDGYVYEPEVEVDSDLAPEQIDTEAAESQGELAQNVLMLPFYDSDLQCGFFDAGGPPEGVNEIENFAFPSGFWSNSEGPSTVTLPGDGYLAPRTLYDVATMPGSRNTKEWNDVELIDIECPDGITVEDGCVFLDGQQATGGSTDNTRDATPLQPGDTLQFGYDWHLPFETGNVVQGDTVVLNAGFSFSQVRHTEEATLANIYAPGENTPNGGS